MVKMFLAGLLLLPGNIVFVQAEAVEEELTIQVDVKNEEIQTQTQTLPQERAYRSTVYLETGKILDYGTGTYLYDFDMNAVTISYEGRTSLALIQELYLNGMRVYCIEPEVLTAEGAGYQMGVSNSMVSSQENRELGLISYFGYGYNGDTSDAMNAATIIAVWMARGRVIQDVSSEVMEKVEVIRHRVKNVDVHPSFENDNIHLKGYGKENAIILNDKNKVLSDYHIYQDGGYSIEHSGNTLKVWLEKGKKASGKIVFDRIERSAQGNQIVYVNPDGKQTLMRITAQDSESVEFQPDLLKGRLRISKQNEDGVIVPNTSFQLSYHADMSNPIGTFTTNNYGYVEIDQLEPMDVYVKEISVPDPYVVDSTIEKIVIRGGETSYFTKTNRYKRGKVKVLKKDAITGNVVLTAGVQFDVYTSNHQFVERITTDSSGIAVSSDLRYGNYYFIEVLAPNAYLINSNSIVFDITEDGVVIEKEFYDQRVEALISIKKQDQVSGDIPLGDATLEGAIYGLFAEEQIIAPDTHQVIYEKDSLVTKQTIKNGNLKYDKLLLGKYYVKELEPSDGYTLDTTIYPIDCSYESQYVELIHKQQTVLERVKSQAFQIIKVSTDGTTGEIPALAGAEFTIKLKNDVDELGWDNAPIAKNADNEVASLLITDDKGYAISEELPYGKYIVKETNTPIGTITVKDFEVNILEDNRKPQVWRIFNDAPIKAHIKVIKVDEETGNVIAAPLTQFKIRNLDTNEYVKFWIKYPSSYIMDTFETDASGSFTTPEGLPYGRYQLEEIKAPHGYVVDEAPLIFEINNNSAYKTMEDETSVQIVLKKANKQAKGTITIEKQAQILSYFDFQSTEFGKVHQPVYENGYLDGVVFDLYAREDIKTLDGTLWFKANEKIETITTTKEGPISSKLLPLGAYYVKEVSTKDGYILDSKEYDVKLEYENQNVPLVNETLSIYNEKEKAEVKFQKEYEETPFQKTQEAIKQTKFGVYTSKSLIIDDKEYLKPDDMIGIISLNEEAQGKFQLDFAGEYYIKEVSSGDAYELDETKYPIIYNYQNKSHTIQMDQKIINKTKKGNLTIVKEDNEGNKLAGVIFELSLSEDFKEVLFEKTTDVDGTIVFENLNYGIYYLREKQTGDLYVLDESIKKLEIKEENITEKVTNEIRKSSIKIKKVNEDFQTLEGVEFSLYDDFGNLIAVKETNTFGNVVFDDLKNGVYHIKETKALPGYQPINEVLDIVISGNNKGEVYEYEVMNSYIVKTGIQDSTNGFSTLFTLGFIVFLYGKKRKKMIGHKNSNIGFHRIK